MTKQADRLGKLKNHALLTDGGLETTLVFQRGIDLPHFASFPLLDDEIGRKELTRYYEAYLAIAREKGLGFILDTPTWRANLDWGRELGYDEQALREVNRRSVDYIATLRDIWEKPGEPIFLNGVIGPRGDGYKAGRMSADEAERYHAFQVEAFAGTDVGMVSAITMNTVEEAIGIARAAGRAGLACVVSFTVETDGRLADGTSLENAIGRTDEATGASPVYYMINCAHPAHFENVLARNGKWTERLGGIRANASTKSHAELDESTELDTGDPTDLGRRYDGLLRRYPSLRVIGGCCGTDHTHLRAICDACFPLAAAE